MLVKVGSSNEVGEWGGGIYVFVDEGIPMYRGGVMGL